MLNKDIILFRDVHFEEMGTWSYIHLLFSYSLFRGGAALSRQGNLSYFTPTCLSSPPPVATCAIFLHSYIQKFWHVFNLSKPGAAFSAQASLQQISQLAICLAQKNAEFHYILTLTHTERRGKNPHLKFTSYDPAE